MLSEVVEQYRRLGYWLDLGSPRMLCGSVADISSGKQLHLGGGISVSDILLFASLSHMFEPKSIFVVGNSFGLSVAVLAELFPESLIDVINAECEGSDNRVGSDLTRAMIDNRYRRVQLTIGYSPVDVPRACRAQEYGLCFVDGLHTNEQMVKDFEALRPRVASECVIVCHDVASHGMQTGWNSIREAASKDGFRGYECSWTSFGSGVLVRGLPQVDRFFASTARPFGDSRFSIGHRVPSGRPWYWSRTYYELRTLLLRKIGLRR